MKQRGTMTCACGVAGVLMLGTSIFVDAQGPDRKSINIAYRAAHGGLVGDVKLVFYVSDVRKSVDYYTDVLGFTFQHFYDHVSGDSVKTWTRDTVIPHFRRITDAVHQHGSVILQQLYHVGQHGDADLSFAPNWSPSGLPSYHDSDGSHRMSIQEIEEIIEAFARAAKRCQKAGFDGVDVFAAYHSLLDQFWSNWSNHRHDDWGGSLENRTRLSISIIYAIREACGEDFIIGMSIGYSESTPFAMTLEDFQAVIALHDQTGELDYVSCGSGNYIDYDKVMPTFVHAEKLGVPLAAALKSVVNNTRVTAESHIRTPENADYVIASGDADMVSIVRGQIADPHLANKAAEGRADDIRGCISCNQMCWGRRSRDYWISCLVNPSAGREFEWGGDRFETAKIVKKILVVGGGPAGMEAARVAAERGHNVTLAEALGAARTARCLRISSSKPPSPPPMISTRRTAPWAKIGTWLSIS